MPKISLANHISHNAIVRTATCVNCWHDFVPEQVRYVGTHPDLESEPQLPEFVSGKKQPSRFIPERFDAEGRALDFRGSPCTEIACPKCKLTVPRMTLELPTLILSVFGPKSSGKTVFIASMVNRLRQRAGALGIAFHDADLQLNAALLEDERKLFAADGAGDYRNFGDVVQATQVEEHESWRRSTVDGMERRYLPPYTFRLAATSEHPNCDRFPNLERLLCLYDNAGEHFDFRTNRENKLMTGHLARSSGLMFTFDPTQDRNFQDVLKRKVKASSALDGVRQDVFLLEAANRIRERAVPPLGACDKIPQSLVVVLTKFDLWRHAIADKLPKDVFSPMAGRRFECLINEDLKKVSEACKQLLIEHNCSGIVATAESVSDDVTFCPVAPVGTDVVAGTSGGHEFRLGKSSPIWVEVPVLKLLSRTHSNLFPTAKRMPAEPVRS